MSDVDPTVEVEQVGPDPRLLVLLLVSLVLGLTWMFLRAGDDGGGRITIGTVESVAETAAAGPVQLVELPHLVVVRTSTRGAPVPQARWGEANGAILLSADEQLVVLDTADPVDGATLQWCPRRGVFEHPDGDRLYASDGLLVAGDGLRGMDRRGFGLTGPALVEVDDGRWVSGAPRRTTDTSFAVRGATCLEG